MSWFSQKQSLIAISTTEAEIVASSEATRETVWFSRLFQYMTTIKGISLICVINEAAVRLAKNPEFHKRTKHI